MFSFVFFFFFYTSFPLLQTRTLLLFIVLLLHVVVLCLPASVFNAFSPVSSFFFFLLLLSVMTGIAADKPSVLLLGIGLQLVSPMNGEQALKSGEGRQANLDGNRKQTRKVRKRAKKKKRGPYPRSREDEVCTVPFRAK